MNVSLVLPLVLGVAAHTSMVMAQSPGMFTPTGNLTTARLFHTATLLTNGKVLIAGGTGGPTYLPPSSVWASAELYDPSTGTFTATGSMTTSRFGHTATLLPNGKVLIAGGSAGNFLPVASAELYDPSTGTFTATGSMTASRFVGHTATLLPNGNVLIAGGSADSNSDVANEELYDPSTGTFISTGQMTTVGTHRATLLTNGKVLFVGSHTFSSRDGSKSGGDEIYDPDTGTFSLAGESAYPDMWPQSASLLTNGKVLVTLAYPEGPSDLTEVYDPSAGAFTATGEMTTRRWDNTTTLLPDNTVLIASLDYDPLAWGSGPNTAELYDPVMGTFSITGSMVTGRDSHTATLLPDGTVLISGGWICDGDCRYGATIASAEIYHPAVLAPAPVLFSLSGDGRGSGAILHADKHQVVSPNNPAVAGEALEVYCSGLIDGSVIPPQVAIGGRLAEILFFGIAADHPGFNQVSFRVPRGVTPGDAIAVRLTYLGRPSNEVAIVVQ